MKWNEAMTTREFYFDRNVTKRFECKGNRKEIVLMRLIYSFQTVRKSRRKKKDDGGGWRKETFY